MAACRCFSVKRMSRHYEGFSNSSIWPLLHYLPNYLRYEPSWWEHYQNVNRKFAEKVLENAHDDDLVWVHDYQLMLLPALLKVAAPNLRIWLFPAHAVSGLRDFPLSSPPSRTGRWDARGGSSRVSYLRLPASFLRLRAAPSGD